MNNSLENVIKSVCEMPSKFYTMKSISILELFNQSGYRELRNQVSQTQIKQYLENHPNLTELWIQYSEDQRSSPSWYITFIQDSGLLDYTLEMRNYTSIIKLKVVHVISKTS